MKTSNLTLALFSCALLSTAYVSTQMENMSQTSTYQASRTIASTAEPIAKIVDVEQENEVAEVIKNSDVNIFTKFKKSAGELMDDAIEVVKTTGDLLTGKKSVVATSNHLLYTSYSVIDTDIIEKYEKLQTRYGSLEEQKKEISEKLKESEQKVSTLTMELEDQGSMSEDQIAQLTNQIKEQEEQISQLKEALAQFDDVKSTMDDLKSKIAQLELVNEELAAKNAALEKENTELSSENVRLACEIEQQQSLSEELTKLTQENRDALERIAALESEKADSDEESKDHASDNTREPAVVASNVELEHITSLLTMLLERQQEQQLMGQIRSMYQAQNRNSISSYSGLSGNYSNFLGRDLEMSYEINRMRQFEALRLESGDMLGMNTFSLNSDLDKMANPHMYNTREGSFANRFIDNRQMLYSPSAAYTTGQFDSLGGYNFNLNQQPVAPMSQAISFAPASQMQPSSIKLN